MPAASSRFTKTYTIVTGPGTTGGSSAIPANPYRLGIFIQNTGGALGLVRFGGSVQQNGSDMVFDAGAREKWDQSDTVPLEGISFFSATPVSWAVMETVASQGGGQ